MVAKRVRGVATKVLEVRAMDSPHLLRLMCPPHPRRQQLAAAAKAAAVAKQ